MEESLKALAQVGTRLVDLASQPELDIASSPGAQRLLRAYVADIEHAIASVVQRGTLTNDEDLRDFFLAKLGGVLDSLRVLLSTLENPRSGASAVNELIAQLGSELLMVASQIEQPFAAGSLVLQEKPGREAAKIIPFPQRSSETALPEELDVEQSHEQNAADERSFTPPLPGPGSIWFETIKRQSLEERKKLLVEEYEAASRQLNHTLSEAVKVVLKRDIAGLEKEIKEVEQALRPTTK